MRNNRKFLEPKPVESIEVSHKHTGLRFILFLVLIAVAIVGIALGIYFLLKVDKGWQMIEPRSSAKTNCSEDFSFYYYLDESAASNNSTIKALQNKYTELTVTLYQTFTPYESVSDVNNVYYVNHHKNEVIEVDPYLYTALQKASSSRFIFCAPVQEYYETLCMSTEDWKATELDAARNTETEALYLEILSYTNNSSHINIEFLGNNKIKLNVSQAYADFAAAHDIVNFVDFSYMKNAFIIDRMAKELTDAGFTKGLITSYDGYTRTLSEQQCTFDLFSSVEKKEYYAGMIELGGNYASVNLHAFATNNKDRYLHYKYNDGTYAHCYFDLNDALSKCSVDGLILYSASKSCSDLISYALPVWIADSMDTATLASYKSSDINYVYTKGLKAHYSDANIRITMRPETENLKFEAIKD